MKQIKTVSSISFRENVALAPLTSIGLGGPAAFFIRVQEFPALLLALQEAKRRSLPVLVLGGGTNIILPDEGFDGLVIHIALKGAHCFKESHAAFLTAASGEEWDGLVQRSIALSWSGLECLSGIPGYVGASPIQNIGAYGQEAAQSIEYLDCLDRSCYEVRRFRNSECHFGYRSSIFKRTYKEGFVILRVCFRLNLHEVSPFAYPALQEAVESRRPLGAYKTMREKLQAIRKTVLELRSAKSMLLDPADPHSRSAGSFFTNPILKPSAYRAFLARCKSKGIDLRELPVFFIGRKDKKSSSESAAQVKLAAAWLIEKAGFPRGLRYAKAGISENHALALVNYGASSRDLRALALQIQSGVKESFGIQLEPEPMLISAQSSCRH